MASRQSRLWPVPLLMVACLCAQPVAVDAQCVVATTMVNPVPPNISVYKTLTAPGTCSSVMNMNVNACFPTATPTMTAFLVASAASASTNPSCSWVCDCGGVTSTIRIDGNDGLPVELMEFEIADDEPAEDAEEAGDAEDEEAGDASGPPDEAAEAEPGEEP